VGVNPHEFSGSLDLDSADARMGELAQQILSHPQIGL